MATGRSGSMRCSTWHCTGESWSSAASGGRFARWARNSRTRSGQGSPRGGAGGFIQGSIVHGRIVDNINYLTYIPGMTDLRLVSLDDGVVFPGMPVTLSVDV